MINAIAGSLDALESYWNNKNSALAWPSIFMLPHWLRAWWQVFGEGHQLYIRAIEQQTDIVGIAPLRLTGDTALFIGDVDVCDYQDFIVARGKEAAFVEMLLDDLEKGEIVKLDLKHVRPDSVVMKVFVKEAMARGHDVVTAAENVSVEMDLPATWEHYLESLTVKQRHEVRRKMRRLAEGSVVEFRVVQEAAAVPDAMTDFFRMFVESRRDKADFLTGPRKSFFTLLSQNMAAAGLLRLSVLSLDKKPVAAVMCFDYNDCIYLYNSGYDPDYIALSAGLLSKALAIKDSIEKGRKKFDFLKGSEEYKYHLGGKEVPLYRCLITLKK